MSIDMRSVPDPKSWLRHCRVVGRVTVVGDINDISVSLGHYTVLNVVMD